MMRGNCLQRSQWRPGSDNGMNTVKVERHMRWFQKWVQRSC